LVVLFGFFLVVHTFVRRVVAAREGSDSAWFAGNVVTAAYFCATTVLIWRSGEWDPQSFSRYVSRALVIVSIIALVASLAALAVSS
jgi:hypothetical protein